MEARDIQTEFVGPIGKDDGKRYKTQTLEDISSNIEGRYMKISGRDRA